MLIVVTQPTDQLGQRLTNEFPDYGRSPRNDAIGVRFESDDKDIRFETISGGSLNQHELERAIDTL